jgi:hypothetical protein
MVSACSVGLEFGSAVYLIPARQMTSQPAGALPVSQLPRNLGLYHAPTSPTLASLLPPHFAMRPDEQPAAPSAPWRAASTLTMGAVGLLCKGFLSGLSRVETHGMEDFLQLLDEREEVEGRQKGLITGMRFYSWGVWVYGLRV